MAPGLLATFPAIRGSMVSTIVVGQAENTLAKTSTPWVITLLHEHFHQFQDSQPNFYPDVNALNLARGDQTGMWMLSYPFPYERAEVQMQFAKMSELLAAAVRANRRDRATRVRDYLAARRRFQQLLEPDDHKYLAFQRWKRELRATPNTKSRAWRLRTIVPPRNSRLYRIIVRLQMSPAPLTTASFAS